jgi:Ni/Co efflux regulator RcnB
MKIAHVLTCTLILSFAATPFALAETATTAATTTTDDAKKAKSKECSTEADAKGLHGKERKKFREQCKHAK